MTMDTFLTFKDEKQTKIYTGLVIAEVKQSSSRDKSPFVDLMKSFSIPRVPSASIASV